MKLGIQRIVGRQSILSLEARDARFILEDWESVSTAVSMKFQAGDRSRLTRKRQRWVTPLLRGLCGLNSPVQGVCTVNGRNISDFAFDEFNCYRANIGFGFSSPNLISNRTLRENLQLPVLYHWEKTPAEVHALIDEIAEFFVISNFMTLRPANVPPGICKIVSVVRAFMRSPEFVILDDPYIGLEPHTLELLVAWLGQMLIQNKNLSILVGSNEARFDQHLGLSLVQPDGALAVEDSDRSGVA